MHVQPTPPPFAPSARAGPVPPPQTMVPARIAVPASTATTRTLRLARPALRARWLSPPAPGSLSARPPRRATHARVGGGITMPTRRRHASPTPPSPPPVRRAKSPRQALRRRMPLAGLAMLASGQREPRPKPASRTPIAQTLATATMGPKLQVKTLSAQRVPWASSPPPRMTSASPAPVQPQPRTASHPTPTAARRPACCHRWRSWASKRFVGCRRKRPQKLGLVGRSASVR